MCDEKDRIVKEYDYSDLDNGIRATIWQFPWSKPGEDELMDAIMEMTNNPTDKDDNVDE